MASIHAEQLLKRQKDGLSMEITELDDKMQVTTSLPSYDANAFGEDEENDDDYDDDYEEDSDAW